MDGGKLLRNKLYNPFIESKMKEPEEPIRATVCYSPCNHYSHTNHTIIILLKLVQFSITLPRKLSACVSRQTHASFAIFVVKHVAFVHCICI